MALDGAHPAPMNVAAAPLRISGVMVVFGHADLALAGIRSWLRHTREVTTELIVVDNASPDGAAVAIRAADLPIRLVLSDRNLGFGSGVNLGALHARGEILCVLNSDIELAPGWLPPLLETIDGDPRVGVVAPAYLGPDGSLTEVGAAIWPDGRVMSFGGGADPDDVPELTFARTVDYAAAACLLVRRRAFVAAGGFDPVFGIGYYEDLDLCLRLAAMGWRTVVEPRSRVRHAGQGSSDPATAARMAEANRPIARERWADVLAVRPPLGDPERYPHRWVASRDVTSPLRTLVAAKDAVGLDLAQARIAEILAAFPWSRVTLLLGPEMAAPGRLPSVVEVARPVDPERWLRDRRYHYSLIVGANDPRLSTALHETQPQAAWTNPRGVAFEP